MTWLVSSSSDRAALDVVDGAGLYAGAGPHYSRRTPGSKTFTGVGKEIVLISDDCSAVWAVVYQRTPSARGTGGSRGRTGVADAAPRYVWRNMLFRNLGTSLSSGLIREALVVTYREWVRKYGKLPLETLRTEIDPKAIRGSNPGCCYKKAGFHSGRMVRRKLYLDAPCPTLIAGVECGCCPKSAAAEWVRGQG